MSPRVLLKVIGGFRGLGSPLASLHADDFLLLLHSQLTKLPLSLEKAASEFDSFCLQYSYITGKFTGKHSLILPGTPSPHGGSLPPKKP